MAGEKIELKNSELIVPNHPTITFIEGDGIGKEIWSAVKKVIDKAVDKAYGDKRKIDWKEVLAGEKAHIRTGDWLPEETVQAFRNYLV